MAGRRAAAIALIVLSWAARIAAIALAAIVVILCFSGLSPQFGLVGLVVDISRALPDVISGWGLMTTPFGGVFRLDFFCAVLLLFACDFGCAQAARALR